MTKLTATKFDLITDSSYENLFNYTKFKPLTRILNALSLTFPKGEFFFCSSIRIHNTQVPEEIQKEIKVFIQQEAQHSMAHKSLNDKFQELGLNVSYLEKEALTKLQNLGMLPEYQLLTTKALEQLTALGGWLYIYGGKYVFKKGLQSSKLWGDHAIEEVQHEFVANDVYRHIYGSKKLKYILHFIKTVVQLILQVKQNYKALKELEKQLLVG